jgi:hypothetical protein
MSTGRESAREAYAQGLIDEEELERRVAAEVAAEDRPVRQPDTPDEIRGPLCSDGMHWYVGHIWLVARKEDEISDPSGGLLAVGWSLGGTIPFLGWMLCALLWLLALVWGLAAEKKRKRRKQAALTDPDRPWGWKVRRCGPDPWSSVCVPVEWLPRLGLRHPRLAADGSGRYLVEQVERSKSDAIKMAQCACKSLSY